MALQLGEDVEAAVDRPTRRSSSRAPAGAPVALERGAPPGPRPPPVRQTRPARELGEIVEGGGALALRRAHLDAGQEAAEVLVALAILHQQRQPAAVGQRDLRADERP